MIVLATKHKGNDMMERGYLKGFFSNNDKTAKMWRQLIEYVHPEGEKALEKYEELERSFGVSEGAAEPIVKHDLASATKLSLWLKIFSEAAASILGTTPHDLLTILQLEDTDRHLQPWNHNSEDTLGINWYLIKETLKKSKYTEKKLGRKITDEDLAKLREVAQVVAKLVDAWGPDNVDYATIWLARGKKVDDLKEFIERFAKDPEKTLQYLEELRQVLHKYIKPKGIQPPAKEPQSARMVNPDLTAEKVEVLSILQALEFADYSEKAKEKALGKLTSMLEELSKEELTPENLQKIGLVAFAVEIIKRGEFERAEEIKRL